MPRGRYQTIAVGVCDGRRWGAPAVDLPPQQVPTRWARPPRARGAFGRQGGRKRHVSEEQIIGGLRLAEAG